MINNIFTDARQLLKIRIDSLKKDVIICLNGEAAFPALLYCFSTIDLLGALYCGDASENAKPTAQSLKYMKEVMQYPEEKAVLLQEVFRHKIVHLAQPKPKVKIGKEKYKPMDIYGKNFLWEYQHKNREIHLNIESTNKPNEFYFKISIWSLVEDIEDSVFGANGYLFRLAKDTNLQENFKKAYNTIFKI